MDNYEPVDDAAADPSAAARPAPTAAFVPDRRYTAAAGGGLLVALILALVVGDAPGRLLFGLAALVLAGYALGDLVFSPRLVASADGIVIRAPLTRASLAWDDIEAVHADSRAHLGLRSTTLEVDAGATLAVFSRRALGTEPEDAARLINAFRPVGQL